MSDENDEGSDDPVSWGAAPADEGNPDEPAGPDADPGRDANSDPGADADADERPWDDPGANEPRGEDRPAAQPPKPSGSGDLLPTQLYVVELLLLPFFWFAPLLLVGLGGAMALDLRSLSDRLDLEVGVAQYALCLAPIAVGYLASVGYRTRRRRLVQRAAGLSPAAAKRQWKQFDAPRGLAVKGVFLGRLVLGILIVVGLFVVPPDLSVVLLALLGLELLLVLATPPLVSLDLRDVREVDGVSWGWPGYVHLATSTLPLGLFVYLLQRQDHLNYALAIEVWDVPEAELAVDESEKSPLESLSERIESALY